jgi:Protein of unknown function (DUF3987)
MVLAAVLMDGTGIGDPVAKPEAFFALPGRIVDAIDPYTEAHPMAILSNSMVMFGNVLGRGPHFRVEYTQHHTNMFIGQAGKTSKGRKGTGNSTPKRMLGDVDPVWAKNCTKSGLSSGEGLIFNIRDARTNGNGNPDPGVADKRLMLTEEEFAQALKMMTREGNILSPTLRDAWDGKDLQPLTKSDPIRASQPHVSVIGHITEMELRRHLKEVEMGNGLANRFIWLHIERSKIIPSPKGVPPAVLAALIDELRKAFQFAGTVGEMIRDPEAEALWEDVYPALSEGKPGLCGAITSRAEAQVLRLSMIYALMDCSAIIKVPHLQAALAFWDYSEQSVSLIFGDLLGDPNVDRVWDYLRTLEKLSRSIIHNILGRNASTAEIERITKVLETLGRAEWRNEKGLDALYPIKRR